MAVIILQGLIFNEVAVHIKIENVLQCVIYIYIYMYIYIYIYSIFSTPKDMCSNTKLKYKLNVVHMSKEYEDIS